MLGTSVLPYFDQDEVHEIHRDPGAGSSTSTPASGWPSPRPGRPRSSASPRTSGRTSCTRPSTSTSSTTPWRRDELRRVIEDSLRTAALVGAPATWVLSNHDTKRHVTRYGGGERGLRRARAAALMMLALPGSAYLYQGEELGLEEVLDLPVELLQDPQRLRSKDGSSGRDGCRVPLPWGGAESPYNFTPLNTTDGWLPAPRRWREQDRRGPVERPRIDARPLPPCPRAAPRPARPRRRRTRWLTATEVLRGNADNLLAFDRAPGFVCTVNVGDEPLTITRPGTLELASVDLDPDDLAPGSDAVTLPPDSAAWWTVG
jgi:alpha-glucosidase